MYFWSSKSIHKTQLTMWQDCSVHNSERVKWKQNGQSIYAVFMRLVLPVAMIRSQM